MADDSNIPQFVKSESFLVDKDYVEWIANLKQRIRITQLKVAIQVNREMLELYWG